MKTSDQKSILFKIWKYPQLTETFITAQIITAIKCGYKVNLLVEELCDIEDSKQSWLFEKYNLKEKIILENYKVPSGKLLRYFKAFVLLILNILNFSELLKFFRYQKKFESRHIYQFNFYKTLKEFDIIHVQYGTNSRPLDIFKNIGLISSKLIVSFHGHDLHFPINGRISNVDYYDLLFKNASLLVVNTEYLKKLLINLKAPVNKIVTIPVSVNTKFFKPLEKSDFDKSQVLNLISIGRLERLKGHHYGIECVKRLKEKGISVHYTLVGEGNQKLNLKKKIIKYNLVEEVILAGRKSQNEIRDLLWRSDLFLMTSITDPDYGAESQGLVVAEAQACGLPVIGFDSGGVKYTFSDGKTGFIIPEGNVNAMVEKIEKLVANPYLMRRLGENTQEFISENFSEIHINEVWKETYYNLIIN